MARYISVYILTKEKPKRGPASDGTKVEVELDDDVEKCPRNAERRKKEGEKYDDSIIIHYIIGKTEGAEGKTGGT